MPDTHTVIYSPNDAKKLASNILDNTDCVDEYDQNFSDLRVTVSEDSDVHEMEQFLRGIKRAGGKIGSIRVDCIEEDDDEDDY